MKSVVAYVVILIAHFLCAEAALAQNSINPVDASGFSISGFIGSDSTYTHMSAATGYSDKCIVTPKSENTILNCTIEVEESNLFTAGLDIQYNVPPNMCSYLVRETYWYYDKTIGQGPSTIEVKRLYDTADEFESVQCSIGNGFGPCDLNLTSELEFVSVDEFETDIACTYDCCIGDYTITTIEDHKASGGESKKISIEKRSWGDNYNACINGADKTSWPAWNDDGRPIPVIQKVSELGLNETHKIVSPKSKDYKSNISVANFYTKGKHDHSGTFSKISSNAPYCVAPLEDQSGDLIASGNEAYSFYCLDEKYEVRNIINVYVRDWDTFEEFELYKSTEGRSGNYDKGSEVEGVGCSGVTGFCNDFYDLDDILNITNGGIYDTSDPTTVNNLFPYDLN